MSRILVIDDDANLLQMVKLMLERVGHEVETVSDGERGIVRAAAAQPDLAIIDVMMPGLSGYDVVRTLRADPVTARLPIIILTARSQPMDKQMALQAGANSFLSKPVAATDLTARVDTVLRVGVDYRVHTGLLTEPREMAPPPVAPPVRPSIAAPASPEDDLTKLPTPQPGGPPAPAPAPMGFENGAASPAEPAAPAPVEAPPMPPRTGSRPGGRVPIGAEDAVATPAAPAPTIQPPGTQPPPAPPPSIQPAPPRTGRIPIGAADMAAKPAAEPRGVPGPMAIPLPVLSLISLRGGTGNTTLAVNLAATLAAENRRICIADLSPSIGQVHVHLRVPTSRHWGQLLGLGETPDPNAVVQALVQHQATGISVLPAPLQPPGQAFSAVAMQNMLRSLTNTYDQVVIDISSLDTAAQGALLASNIILVVLTDDLPALQTTAQTLIALQGVGVEMSRVRLVLNHIRRTPDLSPENIQKMLKTVLAAEMPYDPHQMGALRRGVPLAASEPDSKLAGAVQQLARDLGLMV